MIGIVQRIHAWTTRWLNRHMPNRVSNDGLAMLDLAYKASDVLLKDAPKTLAEHKARLEQAVAHRLAFIGVMYENAKPSDLTPQQVMAHQFIKGERDGLCLALRSLGGYEGVAFDQAWVAGVLKAGAQKTNASASSDSSAQPAR